MSIIYDNYKEIQDEINEAEYYDTYNNDVFHADFDNDFELERQVNMTQEDYY